MTMLRFGGILSPLRLPKPKAARDPHCKRRSAAWLFEQGEAETLGVEYLCEVKSDASDQKPKQISQNLRRSSCPFLLTNKRCSATFVTPFRGDYRSLSWSIFSHWHSSDEFSGHLRIANRRSTI